MRVQGFRTKMENMLFMQDMGLPSVEFNLADKDGIHDLHCPLYTLRTSAPGFGRNQRGFPRKVGVGFEEATEFAKVQMAAGLTVYYYPFMSAIASGVAIFRNADEVAIEEVNGDLWKLTTEGKSPDRSAIVDMGHKDSRAMEDVLGMFAIGLPRVIRHCRLYSDVTAVGFEYMLGYVDEPEDAELVVLEVYGGV